MEFNNASTLLLGKIFSTHFSYHHQDLIVQYHVIYREIIDTRFKCALFPTDLILIRIININIPCYMEGLSNYSKYITQYLNVLHHTHDKLSILILMIFLQQLYISNNFESLRK